MKFCLFFIFLFLMACANCDAQIITPIENAEEQAQTQQMESLIVGTWVGEDTPVGFKNVYHGNGNMTEYTGSGNTETYYWAIATRTTPAGYTVSDLIVQNVQNANDKWKYEINILNNERMILVYLNGAGPQWNLYIRQ